MRYLLNSAVITSYGEYSYHPLSLDEGKEYLGYGFQSTIGYPQTAEALSLLTGCEIPVNRKQIKMDRGDSALVFRLTCRLDDPALKGKLSTEFVLKNYELGILVRIK